MGAPLSPARKKKLAQQNKARWEQAEKLAEILGYRKDMVFNSMSEFDVPGILANRRKPYTDALEILRRKNPPPIIVSARQIREEALDEGDAFDEAVRALKIMFWAIKTIGDPDVAKRAFNQAYNIKKEANHGN